MALRNSGAATEGRPYSLTCRSKTSGAARRLIKIIGPHRFRRDDLFNYQLANLTSARQIDRRVASVIEQTANLTAVVRVDHTGKHIQPILRRQSGSWSNSSIKPRWYRHRQPRPRHHSLLRLNPQILNRTNI